MSKLTLKEKLLRRKLSKGAKLPLRLEYIDPATLTDNPRNWRRHPEVQMRALAESMDKTSWAGALLYNEQTHRLIDGHGRKKLALDRGERLVPVLIGRWTPEQESAILATLDPIAGLAEIDQDKLATLLAESNALLSDDVIEHIGKMFIDDFSPDFEPSAAEDQGQLDELNEPTQKAKHTCPSCGHEF